MIQPINQTYYHNFKSYYSNYIKRVKTCWPMSTRERPYCLYICEWSIRRLRFQSVCFDRPDHGWLIKCGFSFRIARRSDALLFSLMLSCPCDFFRIYFLYIQISFCDNIENLIAWCRPCATLNEQPSDKGTMDLINVWRSWIPPGRRQPKSPPISWLGN